MKRLFSDRRGNVMIEMSLVMIPLMFSVLGVAEIGRAMWGYETFAVAVKKAARYAAVHGARCVEASPQCQITVADIARIVQQQAIGLDMSSIKLTLTVDGQTETCGTSQSCLKDATQWPPADHNAAGMNLSISGSYPFGFAIPRFWPGQGSPSFTLSAKATEIIEF